MGLLRSEFMRLYQLTLPKDDAWNVMNDFGDLGLTHFIDLNKDEQPYSLPYTSQVKACEDSERKVQYLIEQCKKNFYKPQAPSSTDIYLSKIKQIKESKRKAMNLLLEEFQNDISRQENFVTEQNIQLKDAKQQLIYLKDCMEVLNVAHQMLPQLKGQFQNQISPSQGIGGDMESGLTGRSAEEEKSLMDPSQKSINIQHVAGVVEQYEIERLRKLIFRSTKGKSYIYVRDYEMVDNLSTRKRSVYIIVYWDGSHIRDRIQRICDSFSGQRFEIPRLNEIQTQIQKVRESVKSANLVYERTMLSLREQLMQFDSIEGADVGEQPVSKLIVYKMFIAKEKALYQTLNMMKWQNTTFIAYFWAPNEYETLLRGIMANYIAAKFEAYDNHSIPEPTFIKENEFTGVFQLIVNTYGIPTYREANPVPVSIITFPFFFGMMFGDMGHGSIVLVGALLLCAATPAMKKQGGNEFILSLRYMLVLMGFMATYCGFIYNEWFSLPTEFFSSCYDQDTRSVDDPQTGPDKTGMFYYAKKDHACNYPFGMDPAWRLSTGGLTLQNSIKMKLSVIMGVIHMTQGIILKGLNSIYFKKLPDLIFEVIIGLVILLSLFGTMNLLVFLKWFKNLDLDDMNLQVDDKKDFDGQTMGQYNNRHTPSIITIMITTYFKFGAVDDSEKDTFPLLFDSQESQFSFTTSLGLVVLICVPMMLLVKPCCFRGSGAHVDDQEIEFADIRNANEMQQNLIPSGTGIQVRSSGSEFNDASNELIMKRQNQMRSIEAQLKEMSVIDHGHSFGEAFIHQMIETIEFVLGTVSNTASYLRLWALSLAHGQLAEVFMNQIFKFTLQATGVPMTVVIGIVAWPIFWSVTFGVLMVLDLIECFLHCLRLHWVEFQNKFFKGEGYLFKPFKYETILTNARRI